jgi:hypothetical protein
MSRKVRAELVADLARSHRELNDFLRRFTHTPDWRPGPEEWSLREVAAHLVTVERECFRERVHRIAAGEHPHFDYYENTGRDFSDVAMLGALDEWATLRREILDFVQGLPPARWNWTGTHATFGEMDIAAALQVMLGHDREHLADLQRAVNAFQKRADRDGG